MGASSIKLTIGGCRTSFPWPAREPSPSQSLQRQRVPDPDRSTSQSVPRTRPHIALWASESVKGDGLRDRAKPPKADIVGLGQKRRDIQAVAVTFVVRVADHSVETSANSLDIPNLKPDKRTFSSERELQQVIAALLERMPDISGVQILHGAQEHGKDIIFTITGGFGESILCACVVKNVRITGDANSSRGAMGLLIQTKQALNRPHFDENGHGRRVERVYIITPYEIGVPTISSMIEDLHERGGSVHWVSGDRLFDLIKRYWRDYFLDEYEHLHTHLKNTADSARSNKEMDAIAFRYQLGPVDKGVETVYVHPTFQRVLHAFTISPGLLGAVPSEQELKARWTVTEIETARNLLTELTSRINLLHDWRFIGAVI